MVTIYYILNRHIDMERVTKEQLTIMIETITSQGGRIVKIVNEHGQHIQLKFNTIPKRW